MLDVRDLHVFVRTVELGSLSAAGRDLGLSAAAASQRLSHLEADLEARLLQRTTRKLSLTAEGEELYHRATRILQDLDDARVVVSNKSGEVKGHLRVTIPGSFGHRVIAPHLPELLDRHPHLSVDLVVTETYLDLLENGLDLAIRVGQVQGAELGVRRLAPNRRVLCASPEYLKRRGTPMTPEDLTNHEIVSATDRRKIILEGPDGEQAVSISGRLSVNDGTVARDAALTGVGLAVKSIWDIAGVIADGRLKIVLPKYQVLPHSAIYAVYPTRRHIPARVTAFVDFYQSHFATLASLDMEGTES